MVAHSTAESPDISKKMAERNLKRNFSIFFLCFNFIHLFMSEHLGRMSSFPLQTFIFFYKSKKIYAFQSNGDKANRMSAECHF